jgi:vacuole membrane protein 1
MNTASMSGRIIDELEDLDASISEGFLSSALRQAKRWLMSHSQYLSFTLILLLASVSFILLTFQICLFKSYFSMLHFT